MNCDELDDRLPGRDDTELREHLAACPPCRERAEAVLRLSALVARRTQPLSPDVRARVLRAAVRPRWGRRFLVGALAAASIGIAFSLRPHAPPTPVISPPAQAGDLARDPTPVATVASSDVVAGASNGNVNVNLDEVVLGNELLDEKHPQNAVFALDQLHRSNAITESEYAMCVSEMNTVAPITSCYRAMVVTRLNERKNAQMKAEERLPARDVIPTGK